MNKSKWDYKKLGEVTNCQIGLTYKPTDVIDNGGTIVLRSSNIQDNKIALDDIVRVNCNISPSKYVKDGDILMCSRNGSFRLVGKVARIEKLKESMSYGAFMTIIRSDYNDFLFYFFQSQAFRKQIFIGQTATINQITTKMLNDTSVAIPPLSEQQHIVEELDLLSSIIEKKKAQLNELDNLAQSLFYEMFGDPVTNEKGWEVNKLKNVSTLLNGRAYKQDELLSEGKYKVLRVGNFFTNSTYYYSDLELENSKYCDNGDLLFAWSASFGAFIWQGEKVIYHYHIWKVLFDEKVLNKIYYQYLLNTMTKSFMNDVHGIGMVHLTKVGMEQYMLPIPPVALQQQFASKIEAIENQKELIKQSIKEVDTLFNSRMDYYFN